MITSGVSPCIGRKSTTAVADDGNTLSFFAEGDCGLHLLLVQVELRPRVAALGANGRTGPVWELRGFESGDGAS